MRSLRLLKYARIRLPIVEVRTKRHYELEAIKVDNNGEYSGKLVAKELGGGENIAKRKTESRYIYQLIITQKQLDKKFKHSVDFGITTKKNTETLQQYEKAIRAHMKDTMTLSKGTYGLVKDSKVFFNLNTNNVVVLDQSGNFVTGFKLTQGTPQYNNYMKNGVLR